MKWDLSLPWTRQPSLLSLQAQVLAQLRQEVGQVVCFHPPLSVLEREPDMTLVPDLTHREYFKQNLIQFPCVTRDNYCRGSSAGDLGDVTPCNASPSIPAFRPFTRGDAEEAWRRHIQGMIALVPSAQPLRLFQILRRLARVRIY